MTIQEFLTSIEEAPPGPVTLICPLKAANAREPSFEPALAERALDRISERYVDPSLKDLCFSLYHADEADPAEIKSVAETLPFLAEKRVIFVRKAERLQVEGAEPLLAYLANPCEFTIMVLVASSIDARKKLYKTCAKSGAVVYCPELREDEVKRWIHAEAKARGKRIDPDAVQTLFERSGTRLSDVNNAIRLVSDYLGETDDHITAAAVATACSDVAEEQIWTLTDAIANSDTGTAVKALHELLDLGMVGPQLMGSINWLLKSAHHVANQTPALASIKPFVAKKVRPLADKLGPARIRAAFTLFMQTELMLRSTGVDERLALELLVVKLAAPKRPPARASARR